MFVAAVPKLSLTTERNLGLGFFRGRAAFLTCRAPGPCFPHPVIGVSFLSFPVCVAAWQKHSLARPQWPPCGKRKNILTGLLDPLAARSAWILNDININRWGLFDRTLGLQRDLSFGCQGWCMTPSEANGCKNQSQGIVRKSAQITPLNTMHETSSDQSWQKNFPHGPYEPRQHVKLMYGVGALDWFAVATNRPRQLLTEAFHMPMRAQIQAVPCVKNCGVARLLSSTHAARRQACEGAPAIQQRSKGVEGVMVFRTNHHQNFIGPTPSWCQTAVRKFGKPL